ncbi:MULTISPECIES: DUF192 domain-containing protein [Salinibaculum]|uniref:DUF192 domain-containing protein n=1 Tax=Salinibaculum TaxID=2732368 RepID=UPI0030D2E201
MRVVHETDEVIGSDEGPERRVLATDVEVADSTLSQAKGLMFRSEVPDGYALVLDVGSGGGLWPFSEGPPRQFVHMLFMRVPIDVLWLDGERVVETASLSPWTGMGMARADRIVELPAGATDGITVGDTVRVEGLDDG